MNDNIRSLFAAVYDDATALLTPEARLLLAAVEQAEPVRHGLRGFENFGGPVVRALSQAAAHPDRSKISRALIAGLARDVVERTQAAGVTLSIAVRTIDATSRLHKFLISDMPADYAFPLDAFVKDYRFVQAMTVPCGAQVVDLDDGIGPKTALMMAQRYGIGHAFKALTGRWFRPHTERRYLDEFNEIGWNNCYHEIAALLELHPGIRGMAATSWFYDPQLVDISPRLAYLAGVPIAAGAGIIPHGTTSFDIESATATSPTRKALHQQGRYVPVCHSILWDRGDLIAWTRAHPNEKSA